jgi:hypothetical protein
MEGADRSFVLNAIQYNGETQGLAFDPSRYLEHIDHKHGEIRNGLTHPTSHIPSTRTTKINFSQFLTVNLGAILDRINLVTPFRCAVVPAPALRFRLSIASTSFTYLNGKLIEYIRT